MDEKPSRIFKERQVYTLKAFKRFKQAMKLLLSYIIIGSARRRILESYNWYQNMAGGWTHPHCMDYMSRIDILRRTPAQLEYAMKYGSQAICPENLR